MVSLRVRYEHVTQVCEVTGVRGQFGEVARSAISALREYQVSEATVGEYLCDQLLLPLALGEGGALLLWS